MAWFSNLRGTFSSLFSVGKNGPNVKSNAGALEFRNAADSAFAIARALDPVATNDLVTLTYFNANNNAATGLTVIKMPIGLVTKVSTTAIPDNATIRWAVLDVVTAYDASATIAVTRTGDGSKEPLATSDVDPLTIGMYNADQLLDWGATAAGTVTATIVNSPTVGASDLYIAYSTPNDIS